MFTKAKIKLLEVDGITISRGNREEREVALGETLTFRFAEEAGKITDGMVRGIGGGSGDKVSGKLSFLKSRKEKWSRNLKCCRQIHAQSSEEKQRRRDVIIRRLNQGKIFRVTKGRIGDYID